MLSISDCEADSVFGFAGVASHIRGRGVLVGRGRKGGRVALTNLLSP